ncbi:MAG: MarR family transcriptional regulator [Microbacteriaceae bacterium]
MTIAKERVIDEASRYRSLSIRRILQLHTQLWTSRVSSEISSVQYGVLVFLGELGEHESLSQRELGRRAQLDKSTLAELLKRMLAHGLVDAMRRADDRRSNSLAITAAGREVLNALRPAALEVNALLASGLTDDEADTLDGLLRKLLASDVAEQAALR